jgi:H+/gluconate symporter-like permease
VGRRPIGTQNPWLGHFERNGDVTPTTNKPFNSHSRGCLDDDGGAYIRRGMHNLFGLLIAVFAAFWLFLATRGMAKELKAPERAKWIKGGMYLLILIGAGGFFAAALSATGIIKLPGSYE